jgi:uncharacterized membrane protein
VLARLGERGHTHRVLYNSLKLVHVLAVIVWFGGGIMLTLLLGRAARTSVSAVAPIARLGAGMGPVFGAAGGVAFVAGVVMVLTTDGLDFEEAWISIGIVIYLVSAFIGARVIGPRYERLAEAAESADEGAATTARAALVAPTMIDLTLLTIAVAAMVYKWGA